jgi:anthranilate phosphoribosyltransferase
MKHVGPTRVELGTRTIFNLLGPLSNPAGVKRQMVGVFSKHWIEPVAEVLNALGSDRAWIVHGSDGLDEITTTGPTFVAELSGGKIKTFEIKPEDAGLARVKAEDLKGADGAHNAAALRAVLDGRPGPYRDVAILNAAASLVVAGKASALADGVKLAAKSVDNGSAKARLEKLVQVSNTNENVI